MDGTGEPVALLLRPGNAGSNTAADHLTVLRDALRQLPDVRPGTRPGRKVLVRTDAAGCTHAVLNWLHAQRLSYSVGFPLPDTAPDLVARIPDNAWTRAYDSDAAVRPGAWVAELTGLLVCHEQLDLAGDLRRGEHPEPVQPEQHCRRAAVSIHLGPLVSVYLVVTDREAPGLSSGPGQRSCPRAHP
jgi:hypothetical protein